MTLAERLDTLHELHMEVDGIPSTGSRLDWSFQPMIMLAIEPICEPTHWWRQRWDDPPTDEELDAWVRNGGSVDYL
jgi:hypothetical protein